MAISLRVADEVWLAAASLHRAHPDQADFTIAELLAHAAAANLTGKPLRPGIRVHVYQHCVANRPPNPGRYRMLVETAPRRRRLYRPGDPCHPLRTAGKDVPDPAEIPLPCRDLIDWYHAHFVAERAGRVQDPLLALRGVGKALWADEDADDYVQRQREGWQ